MSLRIPDLVSAGPYDIVYADPPWMYTGSPDKDQAAGKHYELLSDEALRALPVKGLFKRDTVVFLWVTSPRLDAGIDLLRAWGLHYRGIAFNWVKTTKDGRIIYGQGVRPSIVKSTTELVLAASPTRSGRPRPVADESVGQVVYAEGGLVEPLPETEAVLAPRGRHSEKPAEVRARIERLYPTATKLEMFARVASPGWHRWGNEAPDEEISHAL